MNKSCFSLVALIESCKSFFNDYPHLNSIAILLRYLHQIINMNFPQGLINFLVYLAPSLMVFFTTWFLVRRFLQRETTLKMLELKAIQQKEMMPLRLQAYERLSIYLERISPNVMLLNQYEPGIKHGA